VLPYLQIRHLDWKETMKALNILSHNLRKEEIDIVIGIGTGGIIPASIVSKFLNLRDLRIITVRKYADGKPPKRIRRKPTIEYDNSGDVKGKRILLVDDLASTGETLEELSNYLREKGASKVFTCSLIVKRDSPRPSYYAIMANDCVIFPWEEN